jgi:UDP-N-acetylglucosamine 2-epimerase (non-hydrolysing)
MKKTILIVFGTRPEALKMAPLVKEFQKYEDVFNTVVCVTGQHRQMLDQVLNLFEIKPDYDLNIMKRGQDLFDVTSDVLIGLRDVLGKVKPDLVLVHGDTTTSFSAALAAFYKQVTVGHIEAGLRTNNIYSPWPEELNRQVVGKIAKYHFSPTTSCKENLLNEGVSEKKVYVTGNTVIDALLFANERINSNNHITEKIIENLNNFGYDVNRIKDSKKLVLITGHRRENFGEGFENICKGIKELSAKFPSVDFVYPMHLNENVRKPIQRIFKDNKNENIFFIEPLEYLEFVYLMGQSYLILTDSGGIQEEAPSLGKPVLVMRDNTERPEAVTAGGVKLVGTVTETIVDEVTDLLNNSSYYSMMSNVSNPYGDGTASQEIVKIIKENLV